MRNKRKILESARKQAQKGARDKALKEYEKLVKLDPRDAKLRLEIGDAYRRWGQLQEAIAAYTKVAEQYMEEGFDARAVAVFKQIQNLDPGCWASYVPLAELYQRMGLTSEAIQSLQTAADGLNKAGKKHDALELLRKMASLDPSNTTSRIKVADLLRQENLKHEAIAEYESAHMELERQGSIEAAGTVLERILEIDPERPSALALMGRNSLRRDLAASAEPFAKRAIAAEPDEPGHLELLADVYRAQGCDEQLADTYRGLADLYHRRGDEDRAREIIQRFVPPERIGAARDVEVTAPSVAETGAGASPSLIDADLLGVEELPEEVELSDPASPACEAEVTISDAGAAPAAEAEIALDMPAPTRALDDELDDMSEEEPESDADPEQQLAEASVYLRYGKRAEALRHLNAILDRDPSHRGALEKLGDAHADAEDSDAAVGAWLRAGELAREAGDDEALSALHDRVAALDTEAARVLAVDSPLDDDSVEEVFDSSEEGVSEVEADAASEFEDAALEEIDLELEIVAEFASGCEDEASEEVDLELEIAAGVASGFDDDALEDAETGEAPAVDAEEGFTPELPEPIAVAAEVTGPSLAEAAAESSVTLGAGVSTSAATTKRISEDLEEAEFYRSQGLGEEAAAVYRRVLEVAPNHPLALVRMGEITATWGASFENPAANAVGVEHGSAALPLQDSHDTTFEAEPKFSADAVESAASAVSYEAEVSASAEAPLDLGASASVEAPLDLGESASAEAPLDLGASASAEVSFPVSASSPAEDVSFDAMHDAGDHFMDVPASVDIEGVEPDAAGLLAADSLSEVDAAELAIDPAAEFALENPNEDYAEAADSFDLAAELSDAFDDADETSHSSSLSGSIGSEEEQDVFSAVFAEFKKGVNKTLDAADHEAHYDLGIAYREMGLLEDAIAEFSTASQCPERRVACLHMLGLCSLDLGRGAEAVEHLEGALGSGEIEDEQVLALTFDLGCALEAAGWIEEARTAWQKVVAIDSTFCDVETRLAALDGEKPEEDDDDMESFDDLIAEVNADSGEAPAAQPEPEAAASEPDAGPAPQEKPAAPKKRRKKKISFV